MKRSTLCMFSLIGLISFFNASAAQTCVSAIPETTPVADFLDHGDGTITHRKTNLMWKVCAEGQTWNSGNCTGSATGYDWQEALQIPQTVNVSNGGFGGDFGGEFAKFTNWRLPNIKELNSIVELKCFDPAVNNTIFPSITSTSDIWTSSPDSMDSTLTLGVMFLEGFSFSDLRDNSNTVLLVRDGL